MKKLFAAAMAVLTAAVMAGCSTSGGSSGGSDYQSPAFIDDVSDGDTPAKAEEKLSDTPNASGSETKTAAGVTVNGSAVSGAEFAYTYNEAYGHYLAAAYNDGGNTVIFMAVLPEKACVSGAEYSGNSIASNGILFDCLVVAQDYSYSYEYNSSDNPGVFDDLKVSIRSIDLYGSAEYEISGNVSSDGYSARILASGQSEYKEAESGDSSYNDGTCKYCNGSGRCSLCSGLGYTNWGGTTVDCNSCEGLGYCYYCQGTGTQIYLVKGVPIS